MLRNISYAYFKTLIIVSPSHEAFPCFVSLRADITSSVVPTGIVLSSSDGFVVGPWYLKDMILFILNSSFLLTILQLHSLTFPLLSYKNFSCLKSNSCWILYCSCWTLYELPPNSLIFFYHNHDFLISCLCVLLKKNITYSTTGLTCFSYTSHISSFLKIMLILNIYEYSLFEHFLSFFSVA